MWAGLNGIDPRNDLVLGGVRIDMGCMNLVVVISRYTRLPGTVTLISVSHNLKFTGSLHADTYTSIKRQFVDFSFHQKIGPHIQPCLQYALILIAHSYEVIRRCISKD